MTNDTLDQVDFWAFTVAFAPSQPIVDAIEHQLSRWWKSGIEDCQQVHSLVPLHLQKEHNPASIIVAAYEVESASPATLIESNLNDRYRSLSHMLSRSLTTTSFAVIRSRPADRSKWPIEEFGLLNESQGGYVRHVWAALDTSGWKFGNSGTFLQFEEPDRYKKRRIRDRFTRSQIVDFLDQLGFELRSLTEPIRRRLVRCFTEVPR